MTLKKKNKNNNNNNNNNKTQKKKNQTNHSSSTSSNNKTNIPTSTTTTTTTNTTTTMMMILGSCGSIIVIIIGILFAKNNNIMKQQSQQSQQSQPIQQQSSAQQSSSSASQQLKNHDPKNHNRNPKEQHNEQHNEHIVARIGPYYKVLQTYQHDRSSFTQGLVYDPMNEWIIEGTGNYGESEIRIYNLNETTTETTTDIDNDDENELEQLQLPKILQRQILHEDYFGEGICLFDMEKKEKEEKEKEEQKDNNESNKESNNQQQEQEQEQQIRQYIFQLTYKKQKGFIYPYYYNNDTLDNDDGQHQEHQQEQEQQQEHQQELQQRQRRPILGKAIHTISYETTTSEGWGITYNPIQQVFYVSDGSEYIHVWDRNQLLSSLLEQEKEEKKETEKDDTHLDHSSSSSASSSSYLIRKFPVTFVRELQQQQMNSKTGTLESKQKQILSKPQIIRYINELEYDIITNTILANVWYQNLILRICPQTGQVITIYDLSQIYVNRPKNTDSMNGISLTNQLNEIYITGKWWPTFYKIQLLE